MTRKPAIAEGVIVLVLVLAVGAAPGRAQEWHDLPAPPGEHTLAPRLTLGRGELLLSWVEKDGSRSRLSFARLRGATWQGPFLIREGKDLIANWADIPTLHPARGHDLLLAAWPSRIAAGEGYGVRLARSADAGQTWSDPEWIHDDLGPRQHGFGVFTINDRVAWLDGRAMGHGGAMQLMTRRPLGHDGAKGPSAPTGEKVLDDRVCECCSIDAAFPHRGPVILYRDRSPGEVRDIAIIRETGDGWQGPEIVAKDGWRITGCPVQGPAVAALGDRSPETSASELLLVAWYTAAELQPRIRIAFSMDSGVSFTRPMTIDRRGPVGRVDAVLVDDVSGWVSWIDRRGGQGFVTAAAVGVAGSMAPPEIVAKTTAGRASGFPKMEVFEDRLFIAWTEADGEGSSRVRISVRDLP